MPFDGSGIFQRVMDWTSDAASAIKIRADRHDQNDDDIAGGLSQCITRTGVSQVTADIPWNGKKITGLGTPVNDTDAVNKAYADLPKPSSTGLTISGADLNGRLTFSSPTGANGLAWTGADLSWIARLATVAGPGDVPPATINRLVLNTKADGTGTDVVEVRDDGSIKAEAISAATVTATGEISAATVTATSVTATGTVSAASVTATGANINGSATIAGNLNVGGNTSVSYFSSSQNIIARGFQCKAGVSSGTTANCFNINAGSGLVDLWIDATNMGHINFTPSDYRIKKDIAPLPSMWDIVKALEPVSYTHKAFDIIPEDDIVRWGFIAHELQDRLIKSAASGEKDEEHLIQSPNPWTVIAALTKALQEAMARIEQLEAKA